MFTVHSHRDIGPNGSPALSRPFPRQWEKSSSGRTLLLLVLGNTHSVQQETKAVSPVASSAHDCHGRSLYLSEVWLINFAQDLLVL